MATLERTTFEVSRDLEYFSERELSLQIGHGKHLWPLALVKELVDNALDACEVAETAPAVRVAIGDDWFSVQDYGPGLPADTIMGSLDYGKRVSDKALYVSPTRGQLGNALKTLWAAPFVATGEDAEVTVWTPRSEHTVSVSLDRIANKPTVKHEVKPSELVTEGTCVAVRWPNSSCYLREPEYVHSYKTVATVEELVSHFAAFNPHANFVIDDEQDFAPTDPTWRKWRTDAPTSAHWYTAESLRDLIAGYVSNGRGEMTVRAFVAEFAGLSSTAKQKAITGDLGRVQLRDLIAGDDIDMGIVQALLLRMQEQSRAPKPQALGIIGDDHLRRWMTEQYGCSAEGVRYVRKVGDERGLPYVLEVAFGVRDDDQAGRRLVTGLNWSPTIDNPIGELGQLLQSQRVDQGDPVVFVAHIACPRFAYTERGKGRIALGWGSLREDLEAAVERVTAEWRKAKKNKERVDRRALDRMRKATVKPPSFREAAFAVMERAYLHASSGGRFYVDARQIMYAARPWVLELTGGKCWKKSSYFTQRLLKDYLDRYEPEWKVVWDARGHIAEPHTGKGLGLGGLEVKQYLAGWKDEDFEVTPDIELDIMVPTSGPDLRYGAVLFIEKEGFDEILRHAGFAQRYDLAIMSTKGMPVGAACHLAAAFHEKGVPVFVVHDLDESGFKIVRTLRQGTRRAPGTPVVDLGLRLADTEGLQSEPVEYTKRKTDPSIYLRLCAATEDEIALLVAGRQQGFGPWEGQRIELNAMTSEQFITWLDGKLQEHGVTKVKPDAMILGRAYERAVYLKAMEREIAKAREGKTGTGDIPANLADQVGELLAGDPTLTWDEAVWQIAS